MVSDSMLISKLYMSEEALEMSSTQAVDALAPWAGELKHGDWQSPLHLMCLQ